MDNREIAKLLDAYDDDDDDISVEEIPSAPESIIDGDDDDSDADPTFHPAAHELSMSSSDDEDHVQPGSTHPSAHHLSKAYTSQPSILGTDHSGDRSLKNGPPPKWGKTVHISAPSQFTEEFGVAKHIRDGDASPIRLFKELFDDDLINYIVFQTNLYAQQTESQTGKKYIPTTVTEIETFLGINILMGIKKLPSYRDYWSSCPDLNDSYISSLMTVNRFGWLLSHLHLNDNSLQPSRNDPNYDKLYKIRPLLSTLSKSFANAFLPSEQVAIDESMIKFKGRSSLKQYMPKKPIKRGYKVWMLCDKSGYNLKFEVYTGKTREGPEHDLAGRVVLSLSEDLKGKNHRVYFDQYFTSYNLILALMKDHIYGCGTVNPIRKNLPALKSDKDLQRGQHDWHTSTDGVACIKWKDKRTVCLMSTIHDPREVVSVNRKEKDGNVVQVPCPLIVLDYNKNMNYVDNFDRLKSDYGLDRKSKRWYMRIFFHFLDCCVTNAYIIHRELGGQMTAKDFRHSISTSLVSTRWVNGEKRKTVSKQSTVQTKCHKPHVSDDVRLHSAKHQPVRGTSRRCAKCSTKANPVRTIWFCSTCKVALCLRKDKTCFQEFHEP